MWFQELESVKSRAAEELRSAVAAEVAAAEERGRSAVLVAAAQEKAALQEQLSYLKAQLQFALKVGMHAGHLRVAVGKQMGKDANTFGWKARYCRCVH
jgi:hypothetical protein